VRQFISRQEPFPGDFGSSRGYARQTDAQKLLSVL